MSSLTRRSALLLGAGMTLTLVAVDDGMATPAEADAEIAKFTAAKAAESGKITIDLPEIAENGNTVPLAIKVDSPMTADDYVSEIRVIGDANPNPGIVRFHLTPMSGRAEAATRVETGARCTPYTSPGPEATGRGGIDYQFSASGDEVACSICGAVLFNLDAECPNCGSDPEYSV